MNDDEENTVDTILIGAVSSVKIEINNLRREAFEKDELISKLTRDNKKLEDKNSDLEEEVNQLCDMIRSEYRKVDTTITLMMILAWIIAFGTIGYSVLFGF